MVLRRHRSSSGVRGGPGSKLSPPRRLTIPTTATKTSTTTATAATSVCSTPHAWALRREWEWDFSIFVGRYEILGYQDADGETRGERVVSGLAPEEDEEKGRGSSRKDGPTIPWLEAPRKLWHVVQAEKTELLQFFGFHPRAGFEAIFSKAELAFGGGLACLEYGCQLS